MSDKLKNFVENSIDEMLATLSPEKRLKGLAPEERIKGLSLEDLLNALSPEDREELIRRSQSGG